MGERDLSDRAAGMLREQAVYNLTERLKDGKRVGRCDLFDLLDCELNSDRYRILLADLFQLITAQSGEHGALADRIVEGLIERHLVTHDDLIEEEATEIENEE